MQLVKAKQVYSFKYESNDQQIKKPFELTAAMLVWIFDLSQGSISSVEKVISSHLLLFRAIFKVKIIFMSALLSFRKLRCIHEFGNLAFQL